MQRTHVTMDTDTAPSVDALITSASVQSQTMIIQQDSPLLNLPGEIKNRIFELVHPSGTCILLRVLQEQTDLKTRYQFYPASPPLSAVCRQLLAEFPIARYYATNTFVIRKSLFRADIFAAFVAGRMPAIDHLRIVRVLRWRTISEWDGLSEPSLLVWTSMNANGIRVDGITMTGKDGGESPYLKPLHVLVKNANTSRTWSGPRTLTAVLKLFSRACEDLDSRVSRENRLAALNARRRAALRDRDREELRLTSTSSARARRTRRRG